MKIGDEIHTPQFGTGHIIDFDQCHSGAIVLPPQGRTRIPFEAFAEQHGSKFKLIHFADLKPSTEPNYLVKGLIPRMGLVVVWGPPKCGKSFWAFDLTMHVALDRTYRGRRTQSGSVVYCAFEGASGFNARGEAFRKRHEIEYAVPFYLMPATTNLVADHAELIESIRWQCPDPAAVVLDTLNRSLTGSESSDEDMAAYLKAADAIREAFDCVVIIVHHCGISGDRPRGHTSLTGAADAQLAVKRDPAGNVVVTVEYMKDGPEGDVIASRLEAVALGTDRDGDEITSCVIVPVDEIGGATDRAAPRLSKNQQTLFSILHKAGKAGMSNEEWFASAQEVGIATKRKADFYDARRVLETKRLVVKMNDERWYSLEIVSAPIFDLNNAPRQR